jgi:hypothetical protein
MKQSTKQAIILVAGISLVLGSAVYDNRLNNVNEKTNSKTAFAGVMSSTSDMQVECTYTGFAGSTSAVLEMINTTDDTVENNNINPVGTPLEDAIMSEDGKVVEAEFEPYTMYVTPSFLNVRSTPSTEEDNVIGKLNINDEITVIGEEGDDWAIIDFNGQNAYICSEYMQDTLPELDTYNNEWTGEKLNKHDGVAHGPSGKETYYNLNMSHIVERMRGMGFAEEEYPYWIRSDGAKMLGNYIMVAANLKERPRGSFIETSLGMGIVCDTGNFAKVNKYQLDIATNW